MKSKKLLFIIVSFIICSASVVYAADMGDLGKIDYFELLRSSFVMLALAGLSVGVFACIVERIWYFKKIKIVPDVFMLDIKKMLGNGEFESIYKMCEENKNPFSVITKTIIENRDKHKDDLDEILEITKVQQRGEMERFMGFIGSVAAIAPLLGLLGTVTGIIKAFSDLAQAGMGGPAVIAAGVSEALVTTAFGLIVAIPVLFSYNYFNSKIKKIVEDIDVKIRILFFTLEDMRNT